MSAESTKGTTMISAPVDYDPFVPPASQAWMASPVQGHWVPPVDPTQAGAFGGQECLWLRLQGDVNEAALEQALRALPDFHEALRGRFDLTGKTFEIDGSLTRFIERHDFTNKPPSTPLAEVVRRFNARPFNLHGGPLFRAAVLRASAEEISVVLAAHASICDGWSMDVVLADLARLYSAFVGASPLPSPPHGVSDYMRFRTAAPFAERETASKRYWESVLKHPLSGDGVRRFSPRPLIDASRALSGGLVTTARTYARKNGVSFFAVLLSIFRAVLARADSSRPLRVDVPIAGHPECELEDCVGPLAVHLPVLATTSDNDGLDLASASVFKSLLDAREYAAFDVGSRGGEGPSGTLLARFAHVQKYAADKLDFAGLAWDYAPVPPAHGHHDASLVAFESADRVTLTLSASADGHYPDWPVLRLAEFETLLSRALEAPREPLKTLDLSMKGAAPGASADSPAPTVGTRRDARAPIIVPMQAGANGAVPMFCLFGIQLYVDLAKALGPDTPVTAMHIPMIYTPGREPHPSLEEIVEHYVRAVRYVRPHGPYSFAGLCFGGIVGYEVARILRESGEDVTLVTILDATLPQGVHIDQVRRVQEYARGLVKKPKTTVTRIAQQLVIRGKDRLASLPLGGAMRDLLGNQEVTSAAEPIDLPVDGPEALADVVRFAQAGHRLDVPVLAVRATGFRLPPWKRTDPDLGWKTLVNGEVQSLDVDCDHLEIVRPPHVQLVADHMLRLLRAEDSLSRRSCSR